MNKVYMAMSADFFHAGHINVIQQAKTYGEVIVGILTDGAIANFNRLPLTTYEQRKKVIENIVGVSQIIPQETYSYRDNLLKIKPQYVIHGDDWRHGPDAENRLEVIALLKEWGGELIEIPYTKDLSSSHVVTQIRKRGVTPEIRLKTLRRLIENKSIVRVIEAHNGLTGLIAENTSFIKGMQVREFDALWESSLTDSASKGRPDTSAVDITSRVHTIEQILEVTTRPMIVDGDNGGLPEHFKFTVKTLERLGVSAVIIEDKIGPKRNSLFGTDEIQTQDTIEEFCEKISAGKKAQITDEFMVCARIESLIANKGMDDALKRAQSYIEAGADGIMIHSQSKTPKEILEFCHHYQNFKNKRPLIVVPSTYSQITEDELIKAGVKVVIYANQLLRSAFPAMVKTAKSILENERCLEADQFCMPIKEIITLIPEV